ncbi:OmpA family protein [Mesorhizobium sp. 1B3]|uniref:OmpA family protein n=1 Tax=Mesorhizobium sp. 1B3 TaxID=3243599 RepID=UPI003D957673
MKCQTRILAGTAIGLLMTGGAFAAAAAAPRTTLPADSAPVILAQAEDSGKKPEESSPTEEAPQGAGPAEQPEAQQPEAAPQESQPEQEQPATEEPAPERGSEEEAREPEPKAEPSEPAAEQPSSEQPADKRPAAEQSGPAGEPEAESQEQPEPAPEKAPTPEAAPEQPTPEKAPEPSPAPAESAPTPTPETQPEEAAPGKAPEPSPTEEEPTTPDVAPQPAPAPEPAPAQPTPDEAQEQAPAQQAPAGEEKPDTQPGEAGIGTSAPILDSQKRSPTTDDATPVPTTPTAPGDATPPGAAPAPAQSTEPSVLPADDGSAQQEVRPAQLQPVTAEEGRRIERRPEDPVRERPQGAKVVREIGDRVVIEVDHQVIVESNDRPRIARDARDVYYEELPRGRTREVILREDGSRVVTIRNRYGDVIRRSRIAPDDREYVLVYVEDADFDRVGEWRDPGLDLPPLRLTIPEDEYILDAEEVDNPDAYYAFLEQPPVERVERLYSIDEVKRSARIRDKTRRVDLDTITFEFGSAAIPESEVRRLEGVATAMEKLLARNPAETFLIEGHTDAVGSDVANLALSDRRAESVAEALTSVFGIPPENLSTQGYGEQYLKVNTEEPERQNRRVAIRRITPLVAPVASAK